MHTNMHKTILLTTYLSANKRLTITCKCVCPQEHTNSNHASAPSTYWCCHLESNLKGTVANSSILDIIQSLYKGLHLLMKKSTFLKAWLLNFYVTRAEFVTLSTTAHMADIADPRLLQDRRSLELSDDPYHKRPMYYPTPQL